jgi:dienelactone hydrolase
MGSAIIALALAACASNPIEEAVAAPEAPEPQQAAAAPEGPTVALPQGVTSAEKHWFSEQVAVTGRIFLPANYSDTAPVPAVVLAPGWGLTASSLDAYAAALAGQGIVALTIDYRGWGKSGGLVYLGQPVTTYDKMRFSEQTPDVIIRRGRLDPDQQVQDIRNAVTFLESMPGVDRTKLGVFGQEVAGGHVVSAMGMDARLKVGLALQPVIAGKDDKEESFVPDAASQAAMIRLAREGAPPRTASAMRARNAEEAKLLLAEYKPFWRLKAIPETATVGLFIAGNDSVSINETAIAASKALTAKKEVKTLEGFRHNFTAAETALATRLAAEWMKQKFASAQ